MIPDFVGGYGPQPAAKRSRCASTLELPQRFKDGRKRILHTIGCGVGIESAAITPMRYQGAEARKLDLQFVKADTNSDGLVTIDELTHYKPDPNQVEKSPPQIEWAMRQIGKYDSDGDGQLSVAECARMIIKPTGADTDGDGFITAKEYSDYRAR